MEGQEAPEETKTHGVRFKATKTKSGRRTISTPDIVVDTLREHRRQQLEQRMRSASASYWMTRWSSLHSTAALRRRDSCLATGERFVTTPAWATSPGMRCGILMPQRAEHSRIE
jgi:hypothetical protein